MDDLYNRVARRRRSGQRGFTLIELLVVIAVLAVLAAIVIFNVTGVVNKGNVAACQTDLKTLQTASDSYFANTGSYPTGFTTDTPPLVPTVIHSAPTDLGTITWGTTTNSGQVSSSACA
jgi:prepilin-type N-terminal cleavage/methylation domain-containing protein